MMMIVEVGRKERSCSVETLERVARQLLNVLATVNSLFLHLAVECHSG